MVKTLARRHKWLLIALAVGASTFALSFNLLSLYIKTEKVVISTGNLEAYKQILPSDVKTIELPRKGLHPESYYDVNALIGSYTMCPLFAGQIVLSGHIMSNGDRPGISVEIPLKERGMFVPSDASKAVGGLINAGDKVDLIWSPKGTNPYQFQNGDFRGAVTVLEKARIVRVVKDQSDAFKGIVVAALPEVCEKIAYYLETGSIYLSVMSWSASDSISEGAEVWPGQ